ncbi:MAG: DUF4339 domain-containing protein, partial [Pirellulaceae bacterium]|nr:DUF4339 domain-containing protein [Pirellulaceae bacterium]
NKLRTLAKRGQLSQLHEVSQDAMVWVRASNYPALFQSLDDIDARPAALHAGRASAEIDESSSHAPRQIRENATSIGENRTLAKTSGRVSATTKQWWYRKDGEQIGPVETAALQQMLASGLLGLDDAVWTEGMAQWSFARHIPELIQQPGDSQTVWGERGTGTSQEESEIPASLRRAAADSRTWVMFVAVLLYINAALLFVAGIIGVISGANGHMAPVVAMGLFQLLLSIDVAAGGFILSSYAGRVASLRYSSHPLVLEKAMDTLRGLWIYISINLIVILAFIVFFGVWLISIGGTLL